MNDQQLINKAINKELHGRLQIAEQVKHGQITPKQAAQLNEAIIAEYEATLLPIRGAGLYSPGNWFNPGKTFSHSLTTCSVYKRSNKNYRCKSHR
jgi:hypothetical protein